MWARKEAVDAGQVDYALQVGASILTYFEDYYEIDFPLPKQGQLSYYHDINKIVFCLINLIIAPHV